MKSDARQYIAMSTPDKIPVILVTGFLGSGKTTLLRHLARTHPDWRMVFLVNEFAATSVDGTTLADTGRPTHSVVGGSLFCECKAGDFIRTLRETVLAQHRETPLDALIIETSGTADPEAIGRLLDDHGLAGAFELRRIVAIVAPGKLLRLLGNLPVVEAQLRVADLIVINKTDTAARARVAAAERAVRGLNPEATLLRAEHCRIDFALPHRPARYPRGELSTCEANPFSTREIAWPQQRGIAEVRAWLADLPASILRVKGRIRTPEGCWHIERSVDSLDITPALENIPAAETDSGGTLVLIAHDADQADLDRVEAGRLPIGG